MDEDIVALLRLFEGRVPDARSHASTLALASDRNKWCSAHSLFETIRDRHLAAIKAKDIARECQYCFEEVCLKSLYNETDPSDPFDYDTPHWISKNALDLARIVGISIDSVIEILSPSGRLPIAQKN